MSYPNVFISTSSFGKVDPAPLNRLKASGISFHNNPFGRTLTAVEAAEFLEDVDGLIAGTEPLTREVLSRAKRLKVISRCGVGVDNVDLNAASEFGIVVATATQAHVAAVAELTLGGMIALLRHIPANDQAVRRGEWEKTVGQLLHGRTVGIIGLGKVGKAVILSLKPFEVKVLAYDPVPDTSFAAAHDVQYTTLSELLRKSEIVSVHVPYRPEVHHLLNRDRIEQMRSGSYLINTSRGGLIDERALYNALKCGKLAGAFIDTFESEPYRGSLTELSNAILSPHVGAYARESRVAMESEAVENLLRHLKRGE